MPYEDDGGTTTGAPVLGPRTLAQGIRERREAMDRTRDEAGRRAEELLRIVLLPDELAHYDAYREIVITGSDGYTYQIGIGVVSNVVVRRPRDGECLAEMCCHPDLFPMSGGTLPARDAHVGQILQLRHDAQAFWDMANIDWNVPDCPEFRRWYTRRVAERVARRIAVGTARGAW